MTGDPALEVAAEAVYRHVRDVMRANAAPWAADAVEAALGAGWDGIDEAQREHYRGIARAALTAYRTPEPNT